MTVTDLNPPNPAPPPDDDQPSRLKFWRRWFERPQPPDVLGSQVVKWENTPDKEPQGWAWVEKHALTLPDRRYVKAQIRHAAPKVPGVLFKFAFIEAPKGVWTEVVRPIWAGAGKCAIAYHRWVTAVHLDEAQKHAEGPLKARKLGERHTSNGYRVIASGIFALALIGLAIYTYYAYVSYFWAALITIACLLDILGRVGVEKKTEFTPVYREPLREGMPYKQLTESIQSAFNEVVGVDGNNHPLVRVDGICTYDFDREEWIQNLSTYQDITEAHVRTIERSIGAALRSIRVLEVPAVATRRILTIKHGDPFTDVPIAPWVPTKSKSVTEGFLLGKSQTKMPFRVHFAGVHVGIVAKSGGGKSEGLVSAVIEAILACHNAVAVGIDLTEGPLFPIYGDCIQRVAYTPEDAEELLDWLLGIIKRRAKILGDIARSDDPNSKGREWNAHLAEMYNEHSIHLIIDELPQAMKFNGQPKGTIDLAGKVEIIARTGSKHWVTLVTAAQKTGKSDSGTTGISSQMMAWLVGPCTQDDANEIFSPDLRRAGWAPNLLKSAVRGQAKNDAGRCYVSAAGFEPVVYCSWTPMPEDEIKRRRARRLADGLPRISDGSGNGTVDAQVVPNTLSALAAALDDIDPPDGKLPSMMAAEWITEHGNEEMDATELAKRLRAELGDKAPKAKSMRNKLRGNCSCYTTSDINVALDAL
jgi:hypothetical protein